MSEDAEKLFMRYQRAMTGRAMRYVRDIYAAEDIVSDSWLALLKHWPTLAQLDQRALTAYIMRCVSNRSIDYLRQLQNERQRTEMLAKEASAYCQTDDIPLLMRELLQHICTGLTSRQRSILMLRLQGFSDREIAQMLRISPTTVRAHWHRIRQQIRRRLTEN